LVHREKIVQQLAALLDGDGQAVADEFVIADLPASNMSLSLLLVGGRGFLRVPARGNVIRSGKAFELLTVSVITTQKKGQSVMHPGNRQKDGTGFQINGSAPAYPVAHNDVGPLGGVGQFVDDPLQRRPQLVGPFVQPSR
jgi:hypothetical protein